jgi:triacylglycerol esterase/lipase EstA (alpha/beta hydrolase family)
MMRPILAGVRLVIRHGIFSDSPNMMTLRQKLIDDLGLTYPQVDNQTYDWQATILRNGVELAAGLRAAAAADGVALVGHSMGGLVCRIANCALTDANFMDIVEKHKAEFRDNDIEPVLATKLSLLRVGSIVTLAAPNSGAMTHSQVSMLAHIFHSGLKMLRKPVWGGPKGSLISAPTGSFAFSSTAARRRRA